MGGGSKEGLLLSKGVVDSGEHRIQGLRELLQFVMGISDGDQVAEAHGADGACALDDLLQGFEEDTCQQVRNTSGYEYADKTTVKKQIDQCVDARRKGG